jgi:hypothetical protein
MQLQQHLYSVIALVIFTRCQALATLLALCCRNSITLSAGGSFSGPVSLTGPCIKAGKSVVYVTNGVLVPAIVSGAPGTDAQPSNAGNEQLAKYLNARVTEGKNLWLT